MNDVQNAGTTLIEENRQDREEGYRTHRVGTITCGLVFVLYGILFLLRMVVPGLRFLMIANLWPVILISLGVEILAGCIPKNQENQKIVYDFPAVLLVMLMSFFVMFMAVIDCFL